MFLASILPACSWCCRCVPGDDVNTPPLVLYAMRLLRCVFVCIFACLVAYTTKKRARSTKVHRPKRKRRKDDFCFLFFPLLPPLDTKREGGGAKKGGRDAPRAAQTRRGTAKKRTETCWPSFFVSLSLFACCASRLDSLWLKGFAIRSGCVMRAHIERAVSVLRRRQQRQEDRCAWRHPRSPAD